MKKIIILLSAAIAASSCMVDRSDYYTATDYKLQNFLSNQHQKMSITPVSYLKDLFDDNKAELLNPDFNRIVEVDNGTMTIVADPSRDSTWNVNGEIDNLTFNSTVVLTGINKIEMPEWTCSGSGSYDEKNGFTALINIIGEDRYSWENTSSYYYVMYRFYCDSSCSIETKSKGATIEKKTFNISQGVY